MIIVTGETRTLDYRFYEMIPPETVGIKTLAKEDTNDNNIESNIIIVSDSNIPNDELYAVILEDGYNNVKYNVLYAGTTTGNDAVYDDLEGTGLNHVENNQ